MTAQSPRALEQRRQPKLVPPGLPIGLRPLDCWGRPRLSKGRPVLQIVWFKRDLRIADHDPLAQAARAGLVLPI